MLKLPSVVLSILFLLLLVACSGSGSAPVTIKATENADAVLIPTPNLGTAVVTGKLLDKKSNAPIAIQLIRLAKIYGTGTESIYVYNESGDPGTYTAEDGTFIINEVEPGSYAYILVSGNGTYAPINENAEKILTIEVKAGQVIDAKDIIVDLSTPEG